MGLTWEEISYCKTNVIARIGLTQIGTNNFISMLQGELKAPWNEYMVQISCRLFEIRFNRFCKGNIIPLVSCYMKLRLSLLQGK
jgi:hypothetical protein